MALASSILCPVLVGRGELLARAQGVLECARGCAGSVLLVSGEAGVGKSRLLRATVEAARDGGFLVLQGACTETERSDPYAPLADLVRSFAALTSSAVAAHAFGAAAPELLALFPELHALFPEATPPSARDPEQDRRRLFQALFSTLCQLAETQPLLLIFEDVHWSDDATLDLVLHLARGLAAQRVLLALTYRSDEVGPRLARLLAELDRTRLTTELELRPLGQDDVVAMLRAIFGGGDVPGDGFVAALHQLTEGNPFFVEEVLKALVTSGELARGDDGSWRVPAMDRVRVPRTAVEAVRRRLSGLSGAAREVAAVAAVAGRRFDFGLLQTLTRLDEAALLGRVRELVEAQLVVEESAERIAFRHALTREAIYAELLARERVALHRAVAAALEGTGDAGGGQVEALAYHSFEAGDWARARAYATRAAEHALALYAPREALAQLERALTAAQKEGLPPAASLLLARGRARETVGDFDGAHADFTAVTVAARAAGSREDEWRALHALGMLWAARDYARAGEYRAQALTLAQALGEPRLVAASLNRVGNWHLNLEQPAPALREHRRALALFTEVGDERGVAETVDLIAMVHFIAGEVDEAARDYERVVAHFTELGDRRGIARALALVALSCNSMPAAATSFGTSSMVREVLARERPVKLCNEIGWKAGEAFCRFILSDVLTWLGRYDRALDLARGALAIAEEIEDLQWQCGAWRSLGFLQLDLLAPDAALQSLGRAHEIALRLGSRTWTRWTAAPLALAMARTGDVPGARALLQAASAPAALGRAALRPGDEDVPTLGQRQIALAAAEVALVAGDADEALALVQERNESERRRHAPRHVPLPRLSYLRASALAALGRAREAEEAFQLALEEAAATDGKPLLWRAQAALGQLHRALGRRLQARSAFEAARQSALELEALVPDQALRSAFAAGVAALVPAAPQPSRRQAAKAAFGGLTARERDVAQLVAAGRSNKSIARSLGIGERTVEDHVAHALAKLGFTSRAQLAAWAVQVGLMPQTEIQPSH